MPRSKSKRSNYTPPKPAKPKPSPRWVPIVGLALIGVGLILILLNYFWAGLPGGNFNLVIGFVFMAGGLIALSQWR